MPPARGHYFPTRGRVSSGGDHVFTGDFTMTNHVFTRDSTMKHRVFTGELRWICGAIAGGGTVFQAGDFPPQRLELRGEIRHAPLACKSSGPGRRGQLRAEEAAGMQMVS
jgi:hypothetical protein